MEVRMKDETVVALLMSLCDCLVCRIGEPCKHVQLVLSAIEAHYNARQLPVEDWMLNEVYGRCLICGQFHPNSQPCPQTINSS